MKGWDGPARARIFQNDRVYDEAYGYCQPDRHDMFTTGHDKLVGLRCWWMSWDCGRLACHRILTERVCCLPWNRGGCFGLTGDVHT